MEIKRQRTNIIVSAIIIVIAAITWFFVIPSQIRVNSLWGSSSGVTGRTFPYFATGLIAMAALGELIQSAMAYTKLKRSGAKSEKKRIEWTSELRAVLIFALCIIYAVLFDRVGYIVSTLIVPPVMLFVMGSRKWYHYASVYAVGAAMYLIFVYLLQIRLP